MVKTAGETGLRAVEVGRRQERLYTVQSAGAGEAVQSAVESRHRASEAGERAGELAYTESIWVRTESKIY